MIDPDNLPEKPEQLTKVLSAGGSLLPGHPSQKIPVWECSRCRMRSLTPCRDECLQGHKTDCPMAGGYVR